MAITSGVTSTENSSNVSGTTITTTFSTKPTTGQTVVALVWFWVSAGTPTWSTVTDDQTGSPNTYVKLAESAINSGARSAIFAAFNVTVNASTFICTATVSGAVLDRSACGVSFNNVSSSTQPDQTATNTAASVPGITIGPTGTLAIADEVALACVTIGGSTAGTVTCASFTNVGQENDGTNFQIGTGDYQIVSSTAAVSAVYSFSTTPSNSTGALATLKGITSVSAVVQVLADSSGKKIDNSELTVGANTVERQRTLPSDDTTAAGLLRTLNTAPAGTEYGLVVRPDPGFALASPNFIELSDATTIVKVLADGSLKCQPDARAAAVYFGCPGTFAVQTTAHGATVGFCWLLNPVGSTIIVYIRELTFTSTGTGAPATVAPPRLTAERITFTGTFSGTTITAAKRDSTDAAATAKCATSTTGLSITADNTIVTWFAVPILTTASPCFPAQEYFHPRATVGDGILRAGEGIVFRQPDAGSASETRSVNIDFKWEEI